MVFPSFGVSSQSEYPLTSFAIQGYSLWLVLGLPQKIERERDREIERYRDTEIMYRYKDCPLTLTMKHNTHVL
jgi:hypothetical protein